MVPAECPGSHLIVQLLCSDVGRADELIGLLAVTDERRKQHSIVLLEGCTRCTSTATSFIITSISIWMAYILACFLSYIEPPVGFQFCCNNNGRIPPPHTPHHPLQTFIITVTLGARPWIPILLRRVSLGST